MDAEELRKKIRRSLTTRSVEIEDVGAFLIRKLSARALIDVGKGEMDNVSKMVSVIIAGTINTDGSPCFEDSEDIRSSLEELDEAQLVSWFAPILELSGIETSDAQEDEAQEDPKHLAPVSNSPTG